jgi:membrane-bound lytic murein transglycosylase B
VLALAVAALSLVSAPAASAEPTAPAESPAFDPATLADPSPELTDLPKVSIELAKVPVSGAAFDRAAAAYAEVSHAHASARDERVGLDRARTAATAEVRRAQAARVAALARIRGLTQRLDAVEGAIRDLAVQAFVSGRNTERMSEALTSEAPSINETDQRAVLGQLSMEVLLAERAAYRQRIAVAQEQADDASSAGREAQASGEDARADRPGAVAGEVEAASVVAKERVSYEQARVLATVKGVEFPLVALDAYYRAATSEAEARPGCGVEWWGVAGIAKVEGRHGTYGGATLDPNGDTSRRIIGIQLNGSNATAVIPDSDGGTLDGDAAYDRAIGPMQFIPSTWRSYEADGNEDGVMSPFNMYDATLAAANYLCTSSSGLDSDPGLRSAYFSYNHSVAYVDSVLTYARGYERRIDLPDRP